MSSGDRRHVYAADMRREVSLQFYPDGFEWVDSEPLPLSLGYSSHQVRHGFSQHPSFSIRAPACE